MPRQEFTKAVKIAIIKRATDPAGVIRCEQCKTAVKSGGFQIDHVIATQLVIDERKQERKLTADDGRLLCAGFKGSCHGDKTAQDVRVIAKAKRVEASHFGVRGPKKAIESRGFPKRLRQPKIGLPPRNLYVPDKKA
jgi:hypothetical protein